MSVSDWGGLKAAADTKLPSGREIAESDAAFALLVRALAFDHDPEPGEPGHRRDIAGARVARRELATPAVHPGAG